MTNRILELKRRIREKKPLIHCITNPISINDCANAVLAVGAKPIMAEHPREVSEITARARALCVNMGNITDARMESILLSGKTAKALDIPHCIDMVGVGCSSLRLELAREYVRQCRPQIIKGNLSEVKAFCGLPAHAVGIDAGEEENALPETIRMAKQLAREMDSVVYITGAVDIAAGKENVFLIRNGNPMLCQVTGTGCMANVLAGTFLSERRPLEAAVLAAALLGIAGETACGERGLGSYHISLIDKLSVMTEKDIKEHIRIEEIT
ncbi:hydroxyethylthiazole kinase [Acetivibrio sp. MSJd-27]|uniref:hydroxyethylthiazole kinase n=1 Tax=Acetivibrio sp. MSJd-27 TaxID=2841523 RepID=UPI001C0FA14D|nr:hydroxyethylthiazole kinase [Acetivibrio sp. MSJd-27]MBU5450749.1 hydroxyethylthiazole kinase [Acetivibrio sp. MSJd-27]